MSPNTSNNGFLFPLFLCSDDNTPQENIVPSFRSFIDARYEHHYAPEEILGYIQMARIDAAYRAAFPDQT